MRYEVRVKDDFGDMGVMCSKHWFLWRADRSLMRHEKMRREQAESQQWATNWHYYIRKV